MMAKRFPIALVAAFCAALLIICMPSSESPAAPKSRIVLLETFDLPVVLEHTELFLEAMEKLGHSRDAIRVLKAQGDRKKAEILLQTEINNNHTDIIVANATLASQVARPFSETYKIPMVFFVVSDPVGTGIVAEIDTPSHKLITGVIHSVPRDTKIEMVMRVLRPLHKNGRPLRFGYIHSSYPSARGDLQMLIAAAKKRNDLEFVSYEIPYDENSFNIQQITKNLKKGIEQLEPSVDFWWISQDPVGELEEFVSTLSQQSKHPIACGTNNKSIEHGALMYVAADTKSGARETAAMVDMILKGTPAGEIPVHPPPQIDYGVNLSTAAKLGAAIPSDFLELAGANIVQQEKSAHP